MSEVRVLKFGGSSVATPDRIHKVAALVKSHFDISKKVIVVVSAMGSSTDQLIKLAQELSPHARTKHRRELDMMMSTGERISMSLLSMAIRDLGIEAISLTGSQSGIITNESHGEAVIVEIKSDRIDKALSEEKVVIVAGFQGVSRQKEITTLGRGGSDTTALSLASHYKAACAWIYSDVDAYCSADPKLVLNTRRYEKLPWELGYLSSFYGAKILHPRAAEAAALNQLEIRLLSTFNPHTKGGYLKGCVSDNIDQYQILTINLKKGLQKLTTKIQGGLESEYPTELEGLFSTVLTGLRASISSSELFIYFGEKLSKVQEGKENISGKETEYWSLSLVGTGISKQKSLLAECSGLMDTLGVCILAHNTHALVFTMIFEAIPTHEKKLLQTFHDYFIK